VRKFGAFIDISLIFAIHNKKNIITMESGTVKFFNESKGFGFIKVNGSNQEVFVHVSGLTDQIRENDAVTFELQQGKKGLNAVNVKLA
jgi:CspA family cold shock protein